jgi:methyl-accepting chemotaxis protein
VLFKQMRTLANYGIVAGSFALAQLCCVALYLLVPGNAALFAAGVAVFLIGLYAFGALAIVYRHAQPNMARALSRIAEGDLLSSPCFPGWKNVSYGQMAWTSLNKVGRDFPGIVRQVRDSAQTIENGSREVSLGYADLSLRTERQAATIGQSVPAMETLSATVSQNAERCREANAVTREVGGRAEEAAGCMQQVTATVARIESSAGKIAGFVGIIHGISFQTSILALNAAVEAARAGEQGHGFAVVAAEVRALAQRSAEATGQIKAQIAASRDRISEGAAAVAQAEQAVSRAAREIGRVVELIGTVAGASTELDSGARTISQALAHLEAVTRQNAALVQEGTQAAGAFERTSARLTLATQHFRMPERSADEVTTGSYRTAGDNLQMGPVLRHFLVPVLAVNISFRDAVATLLFGVPLLLGPILTFAASGAAGAVSLGLAGAAAAAFLGGAYLYFAFGKYTTASARGMQRTCTMLAGGDLTAAAGLKKSLSGAAQTETMSITKALYDIHVNFIDVVREARANADAIADLSRDIARGYTSFSQRTESQASTLEELAASAEELTATVSQNADNCRAATSAGERVLASAEEAARSMQQVTAAMEGIETGAKRSGEFVGIIQGIAFQTNILALNAAVEAARAGQEGRGFAVIATEVRALAQRSAQATEEIKALIAGSAQEVSEGGRLVAQAEETVGRAVAGIRQAAALIESIATASVEQHAGARTIGESLSQLEGMTQQNAALVEEGAAAAISFEQAAQRLVESVRVFRLPEEAPKAAPPSREPNAARQPAVALLPAAPATG